MRSGAEVRPPLAPGGGGPGPPTRGCSRGGSQARAGPPAQAGALRTLPASALALVARHVTPSPSCPPGSPGLGAVTGGSGGLREPGGWKLGREWGSAGRSGRPGVWASVAPVSRSPRGAPGPGWGGPAESAPRGGREGRADRLVPAAGRGRPAWEGLVTPGGRRWASGCAREHPGPGLRPARPEHPGLMSPGQGRAARRPLAGRLPGVRGWGWSFSNLNSHPSIFD